MDLDKTNRWLTLIANAGVLVGLIVLIFELRQNTELMRAQMHNDAMSIRVINRYDEANSGEIARILAKLNEAAGETLLGLSEAPIGILTEEERVRLRSRLIARRDDLGNLFYQCQEGYLDPEFCDHRLRTQISAFLPQWRAFNIGIFAQRPSFLAEVRAIAEENGLPAPDENGMWPTQ